MNFLTSHYITRRARFGPIDAQVVYPLLIWMLHPRPWSTALLVVIVLFLWYLTKKGVNLMMMARIVRRWMVGNKREIRSPWRKHLSL